MFDGERERAGLRARCCAAPDLPAVGRWSCTCYSSATTSAGPSRSPWRVAVSYAQASSVRSRAVMRRCPATSTSRGGRAGSDAAGSLGPSSGPQRSVRTGRRRGDARLASSTVAGTGPSRTRHHRMSRGRKGIASELRVVHPDVPWHEIAGARDV